MLGEARRVAKSKKPKISTKIRRAEIASPKRVSESPLARLKSRGQLNVHELTAADEIIAAYSMSIGEPVARDADLGVPSNPRPDSADNAAAKRVDMLDKYRQWRTDLAGTGALVTAIAALFDETPLRAIERMYHWRNGSAKEHLFVAIRHFAALRGNVPRGVRGWKFDTAKEAI